MVLARGDPPDSYTSPHIDDDENDDDDDDLPEQSIFVKRGLRHGSNCPTDKK